MNKFLMSTGGHVVPITLLEEISSSKFIGLLVILLKMLLCQSTFGDVFLITRNGAVEH